MYMGFARHGGGGLEKKRESEDRFSTTEFVSVRKVNDAAIEVIK